MSVIYEISKNETSLVITKEAGKISVSAGAATICWGEQGKTTLKETLKDQEQKIARTLRNLDKTNRASKTGLQFLLKELCKENQPTLF